MELKSYQTRALDQLRFFLERCRVGGFAEAYAATLARIETDDAATGDSAAAYAHGYTPVAGLETTTPYCCIRLPTGGGKTLLAARAIKIAADAWMERPRVPVIWLVPSGAILAQTIDALKQPRHPYRLAIADAFGAAPAVFGIEERRQIRPRDLIDKVVVIVATYQSFRTENVRDRNVYKTDENLEDHFRDARPGEGLEVEQDGPRKGQIALSFANLLHRQRPLMILDEAHGFMTGLSASVKQRLNPSAIIEFTATPKAGSNVISAATAMELKSEEMIKMPIHLTQHGSWQAAVASAQQNRTWLATIGAVDPGRIRPIVLYQAQPQGEGNEATVDKLKAHLIEVERIAPEAIAVATGEQRELDRVNLFDPACKIEHVITVQALKEGWDCSFAYVFCSVASIRSAGAVEQLLGRVLRMPFAKRRASEELNRAYAHVSEANFHAAAQGLTDRLTEMGFDERTAREAVIETPPDLGLTGGGPGPIAAPRPPVYRIEHRPDISALSVDARRAVRMVEEGGAVIVAVSADAPDAVHLEVARAIEPHVPGSIASVERYIEQALAARSPAERGVPFRVPRLHLAVQGELELAEAESFIDLAGWDLLDDPAKWTLPGFALRETGQGLSFDIEGDQMVFETIETAIELALDDRTDWDAAALARFLDRWTRQVHTGQTVFLEYCRRLVTHLLDERRMPLAALVRGKYALRRAVAERIETLRADAGRRGVQNFLDGIGEPCAPETGCFVFQPYAYQPARFYSGGFRPKRHYYARMGHMNGEEVGCAMAIDDLPGVKHWVRNVEKTPFSYWLPTHKGRFYPDFVAEMEDGTLFVIEFKGRVDDYDKEKDNIGRRFAEATGGTVRFVTVLEDDPKRRDAGAQLRDALAGA